MRKCPKCLHVISNDESLFCRYCGAKLPIPVVETVKAPLQRPVPAPDETPAAVPPAAPKPVIDLHKQTEEKPVPPPTPNLEKAVTQKMTFFRAVKTCYSKYATFRGRASLAEYWWFYLFNFIVSWLMVGLFVALAAADASDMIGVSYLVICCLYIVANALPNLAVSVRRLHDTGKSAWYMLWVFFPCIGGFVWLVFMLQPSDPWENEYDD